MSSGFLVDAWRPVHLEARLCLFAVRRWLRLAVSIHITPYCFRTPPPPGAAEACENRSLRIRWSARLSHRRHARRQSRERFCRSRGPLAVLGDLGGFEKKGRKCGSEFVQNGSENDQNVLFPDTFRRESYSWPLSRTFAVKPSLARRGLIKS